MELNGSAGVRPASASCSKPTVGAQGDLTVNASTSQKPTDANNGIPRETSDKWQREDTSKRSKEEAAHKVGDPKDVGKQAEG